MDGGPVSEADLVEQIRVLRRNQRLGWLVFGVAGVLFAGSRWSHEPPADLVVRSIRLVDASGQVQGEWTGDSLSIGPAIDLWGSGTVVLHGLGGNLIASTDPAPFLTLSTEAGSARMGVDDEGATMALLHDGRMLKGHAGPQSVDLALVHGGLDVWHAGEAVP
jgi:hypothetical protein